MLIYFFLVKIYGEFLLIRSPDSSVSCRWWFDQIINVAYLPNLHAVAFQTRLNKKVEQFSFTSDDVSVLSFDMTFKIGDISFLSSTKK